MRHMVPLLSAPRSRSRIAAAALFLGLLLSSGAVSTADAAPAQRSFLASFAYSVATGTVDPPGANDWGCRPKAGQRPVVLIHGYIANSYVAWSFMSPELAKAGLCVFSLNYSTRNPSGALSMFGTGPIKESAPELAKFVDRVIAATGAAQVDLVGHSEGPLLARRYLAFEGGKSKVKNLVSIAGVNNGTTLLGLGTLGRELNLLGPVGTIGGQAAADMVTGSPFMKETNANGQTVAGVAYTAIVTKYDEVATPYTTGYIVNNKAGAKVSNIGLQNGCKTNFSDHLSSTFSVRTLWYVRSALGVGATKSPPCDVQLPIF